MLRTYGSINNYNRGQNTIISDYTYAQISFIIFFCSPFSLCFVRIVLSFDRSFVNFAVRLFTYTLHLCQSHVDLLIQLVFGDKSQLFNLLNIVRKWSRFNFDEAFLFAPNTFW